MKIWKTKEWQKKRKEVIKDKVCEWCGSKKYLAIHHPQERNSLTEKEYKSFNGTMILCRKCHYAWHKGKILCKYCKKRYHNPHFSTCWNCFKEIFKLGQKGKKGIKDPYEFSIQPCNKKFMIKRFEDGSIPFRRDICIDICGGVNNCEIFKNLEKESENYFKKLILEKERVLK